MYPCVLTVNLKRNKVSFVTNTKFGGFYRVALHARRHDLHAIRGRKEVP